MSILNEISEALQKGQAKKVKELVQKAVDEKLSPTEILNNGLLPGMDIVGEKFKNNEVFVPEVLLAAKAMNGGTAILKPLLTAGGQKPMGKAIIGTVKGDLHDIGKNLVKMMIEGKGVEAIDLGSDVSAEMFLDAFQKNNADVVCCSAMLTTTMDEMKNVVDLFTAKGLRDKVTIFVGGSPINDVFCKAIGADYYTGDAASAADLCKKVLEKKYA